MQLKEEYMRKFSFWNDPYVLVSLLSASRLRGDVVIGECLAKWLLKLQLVTTSPYVLLSNLYASDRKWADLKNLSSADNFSDSTLDSISGLESIKSLDFSRNPFSGDMAASSTKLTNLVSLNLSLNEFESKIPKGLELFSKLEILDSHRNMLSGLPDKEFL